MLGLVAVLAGCVIVLATREPARDAWIDVAFLLALSVSIASVHWSLRSGLLGRIMASVLRTRPQDLEKDPRA